jgi:DnaJ-class molecular chaperone
MKTPYELLAVTELATDAEIKQAYLQQVKLNPPDRDQAKFQQLHSAYEAIKDATSREKYALFNYPEADFNALLDQAFISSQPSLMSADCFEQLLRVSIDDKTFLIGNPVTRYAHE